jgi:DNA-directed RNA polymerase specialized sigma24 family protein
MRGYKKTAEDLRDEAFSKALNSLARYKFYMFGYWASVWVQMNRLSRIRRANPFNPFVELAEETLKILKKDPE